MAFFQKHFNSVFVVAKYLSKGIFGTLLIGFVISSPTPVLAAANCTGEFVNPISDICWDCAFPITIGSVPVIAGPSSTPDTANAASPVCFCPTYPRAYGINAGFWEAVRLIDVSRKPGCFPNLGGLEIELGNATFGATSQSSGGASKTTLHAHFYRYPVWTLLEALIDDFCLDPSGGFDIGFLSELWPAWLDDELAYILHPESALFGSPLAHAVCAADCVSSTVGLPLTPLFWCSGCHGGMYPMTGNITGHVGGVQVSALAAERLLYLLHRGLQLWGTTGAEALCGRYPMPIMDKQQYRLQLTQPTAMTAPFLGCNPPGRTSTHYEGLGGEYPIAGENWGWLVWRKRNCCMR